MSDIADLPVVDRTPAALRQARRDHPGLRARDLAARLAVGEGELLAAGVDGLSVVRLDPHPDRLMPRIGALGPVLALTRNESCVHERDGTYLDYRSGEHAAMVLGPDIDLRLFPRHWVHGFAVVEGEKRSVQVFDAACDAVHKVHLRPESDVAAFDALVAALRLADQSEGLVARPRASVEAARTNPEKLDILRKEWAAMTDTHQFLRLTSKLRMNRLGAYRSVGEGWAEALAPEALSEALRQVAERQIAVMIFVGNPGCIQIHGGPIHRVEPMGPWLNVLDPGFNLHLRADHVAEVWLVRKPTRHGMAVSIEAFDAGGGLIVQIFGRRAPGNEASVPVEGRQGPLPGTEGWVAILDTLARGA